MCITEFNEELFKADLIREGREEGRAEGKIQTLVELVQAGDLDQEVAIAKAAKIGYEKADFLKLLNSV